MDCVPEMLSEILQLCVLQSSQHHLDLGLT